MDWFEATRRIRFRRWVHGHGGAQKRDFEANQGSLRELPHGKRNLIKLANHLVVRRLQVKWFGWD